MDIYAPRGTEVRFIKPAGSAKIAHWCGCDDAEEFLQTGVVYHVEETRPFQSYTHVYLQELPSKRFNSVVFA
jgi:hypothetical protein